MNKNESFTKDERLKIEELAMALTALKVEELQKLFWIMQGMKLAKY